MKKLREIGQSDVNATRYFEILKEVDAEDMDENVVKVQVL